MYRTKRTNFFRGTASILSGRPQRLDTDLFPIEFRFVCVSESSGRDWIPSLQKALVRNEVGLRQNPAVAAGTLESA